MKRPQLLFAALLLLFLPLRSNAQVPELIMDREFRPVARAAIDSIYNFKFGEAEELLRPWENEYPGHPLWTLMEGIELWWEVLSDLDDHSHDAELFNRMEKADYESSRLLSDQGGHADALIIKAISNGYAARHRANRGSWVSSMNTARKALSAYNYLREQDTGLADLKLAEGLKLYYAEYLPEAYPVVKTVSWFLPSGDRKRGLELLREAADSAVFASAEASYFLGNIQFNYEDNYEKASAHFLRLAERYPDNAYYARLHVRTLFELERYDEALARIEKVAARWEVESLSHRKVLEEELYSYRGRILLERGEPERAAEMLRQSFELGEELPDSDRRSYHVISGYFLGRALHQLGRSEEAAEVLEHVTGHAAEDSYRQRAGSLLRRITSGE